MGLKYLLLALTLTSTTTTFGASRNLCDDLIDSGTSPAEQIKRCLEDSRFGPSEFYKEQEEKNKLKKEIAKNEESEADKKKNNFETKKFDSDELLNAGFGKPFYAIQGDYRNRKYKEKRITEGAALCAYLGYEKALKSVVSPELWENKDGIMKVDKEGLIIETSFFTGISKTPIPYRDEDYIFTVRKYTEITCVRRKDKELEGSKDILKSLAEDLIVLNDNLNTPEKHPKGNVDDGARKTGKEKTERGYSPEKWTGKVKGQ